MKNRSLLIRGALASAFGLGVFATSSFAGPLVLGPASMPVTAPKVGVVHVMPVQTQLLNTYRQVRAFWISRAIVR